MILAALALSMFVDAKTLSWIDYNNVEAQPVGTMLESCPDGVLKYKQGAQSFFISIGERHSFDWKNKPIVEYERHRGDCSLEFHSQGHDRFVEVKTKMYGCHDKALNGETVERLEIKDKNEITYQRSFFAEGSVKTEVSCKLQVLPSKE